MEEAKLGLLCLDKSFSQKTGCEEGLKNHYNLTRVQMFAWWTLPDTFLAYVDHVILLL